MNFDSRHVYGIKCLNSGAWHLQMLNCIVTSCLLYIERRNLHLTTSLDFLSLIATSSPGMFLIVFTIWWEYNLEKLPIEKVF